VIEAAAGSWAPFSLRDWLGTPRWRFSKKRSGQFEVHRELSYRCDIGGAVWLAFKREGYSASQRATCFEAGGLASSLGHKELPALTLPLLCY
jgi:hypothetical protein